MAAQLPMTADGQLHEDAFRALTEARIRVAWEQSLDTLPADVRALRAKRA